MQCTEINSEQKHKESRIDPVSSVCLVWQQYRDKQRSKERICWDNILQLQRWNFSIRTLEGSNIQHRSYSFSVLNTHEVYSLVSYTLSINVLISPKKSWNHFYYLILLLEKYMSVVLKYTWKINCFASESSNRILLWWHILVQQPLRGAEHEILQDQQQQFTSRTKGSRLKTMCTLRSRG